VDLHRHSIIAVPGLGTNPEECWTFLAKEKGDAASFKLPKFFGSSDPSKASKAAQQSDHNFNWLRDSDGLASLCPKARIMLYDYASAWKGKLKVRATMRSVCQWLLEDLIEKRRVSRISSSCYRTPLLIATQEPTEVTRPLIFIGHSMGGIVVAKVRLHK
jgi:hypothetical protein